MNHFAPCSVTRAAFQKTLAASMGCCCSAPTDRTPAEGSTVSADAASTGRLEQHLELRRIKPRSHPSFHMAATRDFPFEHGDVVGTVLDPLETSLANPEAAVRAILDLDPSVTAFQVASMDGGRAAYARAVSQTPCCKFVDDLRIEVHLTEPDASSDDVRWIPVAVGIWSASRVGTNDFGKNESRVRGIVSRIRTRSSVFRDAPPATA